MPGLSDKIVIACFIHGYKIGFTVVRDHFSVIDFYLKAAAGFICFWIVWFIGVIHDLFLS